MSAIDATLSALTLRTILMAAASANAITSVTVAALDDADLEIRVEQLVMAGCEVTRDEVCAYRSGGRYRLAQLWAPPGAACRSVNISTDATAHEVGPVVPRDVLVDQLAETADRVAAGESLGEIRAQPLRLVGGAS